MFCAKYLLVAALIALTAVVFAQRAQDADKPFANMQFKDQKDKARITTCIGQCLTKYPGAREFIMNESMN